MNHSLFLYRLLKAFVISSFVVAAAANAAFGAGTNALPERVISADLHRVAGPMNTLFKACVGAGRANETIGVIHKIQDRRDDNRPGDNADYQCNLLLPRRRIYQLSGLEILKVVVRDCRDIKNYRCGKER